jgi:hypothetical protein
MQRLNPRSRVGQSPRRYSAACASGVCNLSCVVLSRYEDYCRHYPFVRGAILPVAVALAPLLVLSALRRVSLVVLIYVSVLPWILVQQVHEDCTGLPPNWRPHRPDRDAYRQRRRRDETVICLDADDRSRAAVSHAQNPKAPPAAGLRRGPSAS